LLTNNATTEQLARIIASNDRGLILYRDELAGWVGQMDKYGGNGADRASYLEAFGGRPCVIDRVKDAASLRVPHFSVGILGGIQPDRLATMLLAGDDDGLCAQFLFAWPEPQQPTRPRYSAHNIAALGRLRWLLTLAPEETETGQKAPKVLPMEPTAADRLHAWRLEIATMEASASGLFLSWLGKMPGVAVRLALVFELLWWSESTVGLSQPEQISLRAVDAAVSMLAVKRHQELIPWRHKELTGEDYARAHGPVALSGSAHPGPLARMRYRVWKVAACTTMSCSGRRSGAAGVHDDHPELLAEALEIRLEVREPVQDQVDEDDRGLAAAVRVVGQPCPVRGGEGEPT
jgi:hypothetical protein